MRTTISAGELYAYTTMPDVGSFLVLIDFDVEGRLVGCLSLPDMQNCTYTADEIFELQDAKILDLVDTLPDDVYKVCRDHFAYSHKETEQVLDKLLTNIRYDSDIKTCTKMKD